MSHVGGRRRVVVLACGHPDRGDDAAGLRALELLATDPGPGAGVALRAVGALEVEHVLAIAPDEACVVVDAVDGPAPGEVLVRPLASLLPLAGVGSAHDAGRGRGFAPRSGHAVPIPDVLALADTLRPGLPPGSFVGIGIASTGFGTTMSPAVADGLPALSRALAEEVARLRGS